jgi:hypothetical protein
MGGLENATMSLGRTNRKFGRAPREHDPHVPRLSAMLPAALISALPTAVDHTKNGGAALPADLGMMLNDKLNNCTCAAYYHARQIWTFQVRGHAETEPNANVELLYEHACGYKPSESGEGPPGFEQRVLWFLHHAGAPVGSDAKGREKVVAYFEVEPHRIDHVKQTIVDCCVAYAGINVPKNVYPPNGEPPALWTVDPMKPKIVEGHAIVIAGYDATGPIFISWGRRYAMTWEFFATYVDEVYAMVDRSWMTAMAKTPGGLSLHDLEERMRPLHEAHAQR